MNKTEVFPKLKKTSKPQIQEVWNVLCRINKETNNHTKILSVQCWGRWAVESGPSGLTGKQRILADVSSEVM